MAIDMTTDDDEHVKRAISAVQEQYRLIVETQRRCQGVIIAIAQIMDWGPVELNRIIGAPFFNVAPAPPPTNVAPPAPETEPK